MYRPVQRRIVIFLLKLWGPHIRDPSSCLHFLYYRHEGSYKGLLISEVGRASRRPVTTSIA